MSLEDLAEVALSSGYRALCMRASQLGIQTPLDEVREKRRMAGVQGSGGVDDHGRLPHTGEHGRRARRAAEHHTVSGPHAEALDSDLMRIGMKTYDDIAWAQRACDEAKRARDAARAPESY